MPILLWPTNSHTRVQTWVFGRKPEANRCCNHFYYYTLTCQVTCINTLRLVGALQPCAICIVAPPNYPSCRGRTIYRMARAKHHSNFSKHRCKMDSIEKLKNASACAACRERLEEVPLLHCSMTLVLRYRNWKWTESGAKALPKCGALRRHRAGG